MRKSKFKYENNSQANLSIKLSGEYLRPNRLSHTTAK